MEAPPVTTQAQTQSQKRACDECKRRKVKCSAEEPKCLKCVRDRKTCVYSSPAHRLSDLQRKITRYEKLFNDIRRAWETHLPNTSLEDALVQLDGPNSSNRKSQKAVALSPTSSSTPPMTDYQVAQSDTGQLPHSDPSDYEFDESHDFDDMIDGMGFLTAESCKSGYTGPTSGIAALKILRSLPSESRFEAADGLAKRSPSHELSPMSERNAVDVDTMIDDYFSLFHPAYPLLHEGLFRARVLGAVPKPRDGSWPLLYGMVVAMGGFVGGNVETTTDLKYYRMAKDSISLSLLEKGSICYVQGLALMANYLQKRNKPNAGFAMIGIAWSMALSIGLHREFGNFSTSPYTMEIRRRAWWTLFIFVSGAQLTFGRPPASLVGVNVHIPTNLDDRRLAIDMAVLPDEQDGPTTATSLIWQIKLANIGNAIQAELLTNHIPALEAVHHLDQQILAWTAELPKYYETNLPMRYELPKRVLIWRSYHLRIVLNRSFLFQAVTKKAELSPDDRCTWNCVETADACVGSIYNFVMNNNIEVKRGFAWYTIYWILTASVVHATCLAYVPTHSLADQWKLQLERSIEVLQRLTHAQAMADQAQRVLKRLLSRYTRTTVPSATAPQQETHWQPPTDPPSNPSGGHADQALDPLLMSENSLMPETAADLLWLWSQSADTEFLDAAGSTMFPGHHTDSWGGS